MTTQCLLDKPLSPVVTAAGYLKWPDGHQVVGSQRGPRWLKAALSIFP